MYLCEEEIASYRWQKIMPSGYFGQQSLCTIKELIGNVSNLLNSSTLLDVGCGNGAFSIYISEEVPSLHINAIDIDDGAIEEAAVKAYEKGLSTNVDFMVLNMDEWHNPMKYDVIFSADVIQHSKSPTKLLAHLLSMWSMHGPFGISVWWFESNQAGKSIADRWGCGNGVSLNDYRKYIYHNELPVSVVNNTLAFKSRLERSLKSLLRVEASYKKLYGNGAFERRLSLENDTVRSVQSGDMGQAYIMAGANKLIQRDFQT